MSPKIIFFSLFIILQINMSYALDWQRLHEQADQIKLPEALSLIQASSDSIDNLYILGLVYLNLHKDSEAGEIFSKISSLSPNVIEAKWGRAEVLRRQHNIDNSEKELDDIIKLNPSFAPAYVSLAYIKYIQMNFNEAVRLANLVLAMGEKNVDRGNHVRAYLLRSGTKGMIAYYGGPLSKIINGTAVLPGLREAERLQPNAAGVKFGLGSFYLLAPDLAGGDIEKAEGYLKQAIEIDPFFADAYVRIAQVYKVKGDIAKYREYLRKAQEIDPQNELAADISSHKCKFICLDKKG